VPPHTVPPHTAPPHTVPPHTSHKLQAHCNTFGPY
jgi:hypothetical protein